MIHTRGPSRCSPAGRRAGGILALGAPFALAVVLFSLTARAQVPPPSVSVKLRADGRLAYSADAAGNRVVDFSHAGYGGGGVALPDVPVRIIVGPGGGRDRQRIQAALNLVSALPLDGNGFRGTVLLERGTYTIESELQLRSGGVVLRGFGAGEDGSVLVAAGTSRRPLITMAGRGDRQEESGSRRAIAGAYVPVGAMSFTVDDAAGLAVWSRIIVRRPSTPEWIAALGMNLFQGWRPENRLHWQPGSRDIDWDRVVTAVQGNRISIDASLTTAIDARYGGGVVFRYAFPGRIGRVGVENLRLVSAYDQTRPMDEDHAWSAITIDKVENAWVRHVVAAHFVSSVINAGADALRVTVEDVEALDPVSEPGGYRRRVFCTAGQLTLFRRCRSERGLHDFVAGFAAAGPNVFLESTARDALDYSGPLESWASGVLYDNFYFQHWLLESRSHYVDFPWRPVNTIQQTGLPDEVPAANVFYDVTHPLRRELHRLYIRHALDVFQDNTNVVHGIDREYTGPIEFVQFWLDTIAEWQKEHGRTLFISLEIPKAQMDAILEDPVRGPMISAIDMLGWTYRADGSLFAARGGINRAPREQRPDVATPEELDTLKAKLGVAATDQRDFLNGPEFQKLFDQLWASSKPMKYRAWREYRDRFPKIVLLWNGDEYPAVTRVVEAAIPAAARAGMRPADVVRTHLDTSWCMARRTDTFVVYTMTGDAVALDLTASEGAYEVSWLDLATGVLQKSVETVPGGRVVNLTPPAVGTGRPWVAWLSRVK